MTKQRALYPSEPGGGGDGEVQISVEGLPSYEEAMALARMVPSNARFVPSTNSHPQDLILFI